MKNWAEHRAGLLSDWRRSQNWRWHLLLNTDCHLSAEDESNVGKLLSPFCPRHPSVCAAVSSHSTRSLAQLSLQLSLPWEKLNLPSNSLWCFDATQWSHQLMAPLLAPVITQALQDIRMGWGLDTGLLVVVVSPMSQRLFGTCHLVSMALLGVLIASWGAGPYS